MRLDDVIIDINASTFSQQILHNKLMFGKLKDHKQIKKNIETKNKNNYIYNNFWKIKFLLNHCDILCMLIQQFKKLTKNL